MTTHYQQPQAGSRILNSNGPMILAPLREVPPSVPAKPTVAVATEVTERVVSDVVIRPQEAARAYLARGEDAWSWEDLRDYVVHEIQQRFGVQPRNLQKEMGIFKSFIDRWGVASAVAIARHVFEVYDGRWRSAPVGVNRFCKGSDPYFAAPIQKYLVDNGILAV